MHSHTCISIVFSGNNAFCAFTHRFRFKYQQVKLSSIQFRHYGNIKISGRVRGNVKHYKALTIFGCISPIAHFIVYSLYTCNMMNWQKFIFYFLLEIWLNTLVFDAQTKKIIINVFDKFLLQVHQRMTLNGLKQQVNSTKLFMPGFLFFPFTHSPFCVCVFFARL